MPSEHFGSNDQCYDEDGSKPVAVVALANALLDMSVSIPDDTLIKKYGLPCDGQLEVTKEQQQLFAEVLENYKVEYVAGGSAQNTVRLVSRLINNQWPCYVVGKISRDRIGTILQRLLAEDGVRTRYVYDEVKPTGCCVAMVRPDGTRCLAANIGAARCFTLEDYERIKGSDLVDSARILYTEGFFASHSPDVALTAMRRAHSRGSVIRLLSLSARYICLESHTLLWQLLPYANVVVGNEDEFRALAERCGLLEDPSGESISSVARKIASARYISPGNQMKPCLLADFPNGDIWDWTRLNERLVVVTCGADGAVCASQTDAWEFPVEKLDAEEIKDTTGAGDAFLAGFLSQVLVGRPLGQCVAAGHATARIVISQTGCRLPD